MKIKLLILLAAIALPLGASVAVAPETAADELVTLTSDNLDRLANNAEMFAGMFGLAAQSDATNATALHDASRYFAGKHDAYIEAKQILNDYRNAQKQIGNN